MLQGVGARNPFGRSTCRVVQSFAFRNFSSSDEGNHDDFWTEVKTEAQLKEEAYQEAARVEVSTSTPLGGEWAAPGQSFSKPSERPAGEAYRPYSQRLPPMTSQQQGQRQHEQLEPAFDMQSSSHLSPMKKVVVRKFEGIVLVDIRRFFKTRGNAAIPGKKGISLTVPQWKRLKAAMDDIDSQIQKKEDDLGI